MLSSQVRTVPRTSFGKGLNSHQIVVLEKGGFILSFQAVPVKQCSYWVAHFCGELLRESRILADPTVELRSGHTILL